MRKLQRNRAFLITIAVLSSIWIFYSIATRDRVEKKDFINFEWMTGKWVQETDSTVTYEIWEDIDENILEGRSFTLKNGDTVFAEELRIIKMDHDYYYIAKPVNKSGPTMFKMELDSIRKVRFVNEKNDFPKCIQYRRRRDSMIADIGNIDKIITFKYKLE